MAVTFNGKRGAVGTLVQAVTGPNGEVNLQVGNSEIAANGMFDIRSPAFGAKCDGIALYDATTTNSATCTVGSASASFTSADIGKVCAVIPATASSAFAKYGTITAVAANGLSCTASLNATPGTLTGATFIYGTDDTAAITAAMTAASSAILSTRGTVFVPRGIACTTGRITVPDGVSLTGTGNTLTVDYARNFRHNGSNIVLVSYEAGLGSVIVGDGSSSSKYSSTISKLNIDCLNLCGQAIYVSNRACHLHDATFVRGTNSTAALYASGVTNGCIFIQQQYGHGVIIGGDSRFTNNYVYGAGANKHNVKISGSADVFCGFNHIWKDADTATAYGSAVFVEFWTGTKFGVVTIQGNQFDTSFGPHVQVTVTGSSIVGRGVNIIANHGFQNDLVPNATYPFIDVNIDATCSLRGFLVQGNLGQGSWNDPTKGQYTYFVDGSGVAGNIYGSITGGNFIDNCAALTNFSAAWTAWDHDHGNIVIAGTGTTLTKSTTT